MTSSDRSGALPLDTSEPACPGASPEPLPGTPALRLVASDSGPIPATRADPDRPLGEVPDPRTVPDQLSFDPFVPHSARVYDYGLRSKDNYVADREAAEKALAVVPHGRRIARANRAFLAHAVERMARSVRMPETGEV